jgi:hypothetical protein
MFFSPRAFRINSAELVLAGRACPASQGRDRRSCAEIRLGTANQIAGTEGGGAVPAGVEEADERGRGVVGDAADPEDGPAGLAALPVLAQAPLEDARQHRRRRGLRARKHKGRRRSLVRPASRMVDRRGSCGIVRERAERMRRRETAGAGRTF